MYFVDQQQIHQRLEQVTLVHHAAVQVQEGWDNSLIMHMAEERALHLAIEIVTDVGSLLIDGFIMRDASSYEDIIEIIAQEGVLGPEQRDQLLQLVLLRKPLVQQYADWKRDGLHPLLPTLPACLEQFKSAVEHYLKQELGGFANLQ